jgi:hypothetical protein
MMSNGKSLNRFFQNANQALKEGDPRQTTAKYYKAFCGYYEPAHDGRICRIDIQAHRHAGGV